MLLAYPMPGGVGEHDLLELSERMNTAADETPKKYLANSSAQTSRPTTSMREARCATCCATYPGGVCDSSRSGAADNATNCENSGGLTGFEPETT